LRLREDGAAPTSSAFVSSTASRAGTAGGGKLPPRYNAAPSQELWTIRRFDPRGIARFGSSRWIVIVLFVIIESTGARS
jgi:hypothetical protein